MVVAIAAISIFVADGAVPTFSVFVLLKPPPELVQPILSDLPGNVTAALYQAALLHRYSILNRSNMYVPSPMPSALDLVGTVQLGVLATKTYVEGVLTENSMIRVVCDRNSTAFLLWSMANMPLRSVAGGIAFRDALNPLQALGIVGAQWVEPEVVAADDNVSLAVTISLAILFFIAALTVSAIATRRRLIRDSRGINFNDLIRLEVELFDDVARQLEHM